MLTRFRLLLLVGGLLAVSSFAWADHPLAEVNEDPVLGALVADALARNPDLLAAREALAASRQRVPQAGALPDPMLSVGYTNDGWSPSLGGQEMTTLAFMASQDLPFPGKRRLQSDIASREAGQVEQQLERTRLRLVAEVKRAYHGLLLARDLLALTQEQRQVWGEIEGVVRARYAVGQGAQQDVLRVQVELTRVEEREAEQAAEADIRLAELNRLRDRSVEQPLETAATQVLRPLVPSLTEALTQARGVSPELVSAGLAVERNRLAIRLAQKELRPDFTLQAGYMNRGGLEPMWQAGIGVTLPMYRKKRTAAVAEAEARVRGGERLLESIDLQLRYRTQERVTRLKTTERIATLYGNGIIPQDRMSVEAAIANYKTGNVPFVTVLEALTTLYGDRWTHARLVADHARLLASLEEASLEPTAGMTAATAPPAALGESGAMSGGMSGR
ncbi:MAG TPA: TolC family protein [Vicinamibacteria bacterium]|nr:TolC family protein [Vicinamibacteria bacterium]